MINKISFKIEEKEKEIIFIFNNTKKKNFQLKLKQIIKNEKSELILKESQIYKEINNKTSNCKENIIKTKEIETIKYKNYIIAKYEIPSNKLNDYINILNFNHVNSNQKRNRRFM